MSDPARYPKRLIEVDLPIKRISAHARREKSIRHGHISTLHIWWARRPLAACRAVLCAALWPDPADPLCPQAFRDHAAALIGAFARKAATTEALAQRCSEVSLGRWVALARLEREPGTLARRYQEIAAGQPTAPVRDISLDSANPDHLNALRYALLDFIADFANWDNATQPDYLETARALTQAAHEALGGAPGTRPLVVDPFAGGGAIPLEALRVGADAFASDLNPVAVLLNKVVLEHIPRYGQQLADEVRKWGAWIKEQAEKELAEFYPKDPDGATPIAYLWARTITCEGPNCGAEVPLMRSLWLAKKGHRSVALRMIRDVERRRVDFEIVQGVKEKDVQEGTVRRGSAVCPVCGYTTPVASVRRQLRARRGGAADARLFCVVTTRPGEQGRFYRLPTERDLAAARKAAEELGRRKAAHTGPLSLVPDEPLPPQGTLGFRVQLYGMLEWGDLFTPRQALALTTLARLVREVGERLAQEHEPGLASAVQTALALAVSRHADINASLAMWHTTRELITHVFGRQALPIVWDFAEANSIGNASGAFDGGVDWIVSVLQNHFDGHGQTDQASATNHPLPDDAVQCFITDPPYYDAVPYADLSDFFYVWLKRTTGGLYAGLFSADLTPKDDECIVDEVKGKDRAYFEHTMAQAMAEGRRILNPAGVGVVVFAHKSTAGWEAQLQAMVDAGWTITGSWPIDTEMGTRLRARDSAALASSIHLVCRPRETPGGDLHTEVGDWRDVLQALPRRIHEWLPRLAREGVVGADAIFACLGPALEIFSRYSRVEKASGEAVSLREYMEYVWAAVAHEALGMIFQGADATGFEEDARLTAMWLWTLLTETGGERQDAGEDEEGEEGGEDEDRASGKGGAVGGYVLEYDAARKIAQGIGAHLEQLTRLVEVKGDKARLLPVRERAARLLGRDAGEAPARRKRRESVQLSFLDAADEGEEPLEEWDVNSAPLTAETVLDRLHQSMLIFADGRSEALKRFLVEEGAGSDPRFWRLAQALSALYPVGSEEKRWVDGVMARKKGLGF